MCRPSSFEYVTATSRSPNTGDTVPVSRRPEPRLISTSTASGWALRYGRAASASRAARSRISVALRQPNRPGGNVPRRHSASRASSGLHAAQHVLQHPVADRPLLEGVDVDGHSVLHPVDLPRQRVVERAEEPLHRVAEKGGEVGEHDVIGRGSGQWAWRRKAAVRRGCLTGRALHSARSDRT